MGMKQILVMMAAAVVLVGCGKNTPESSQSAEAEAQEASKPSPEPDPISPAEEKVIAIADPIFEKAIRIDLGKYTGKLTEADLAKVIALELHESKTTDAGLKGLAKLQKLENLLLEDTQITNAGVAELKKALPNCEIVPLINPPRGTF